MTDAIASTSGNFPASSGRPAEWSRWAPANWFAVLSESDPASLRYLLVLRFAVLNLVGVALVAAVWAHGWLDGMIATDVYHLVKLNVGVFLVGLTLCGNRILKLSQDLNELADNAYNPASRANVCTLIQSSLTISGVAEECGTQVSAYFAIRRNTGVMSGTVWP